MMNSIIKTIILLLSVILYTGCAVKYATYSIEEVEKHKWYYENQQKQKSLDILIRIYQDPNQTDDARLLALSALSDINHPKVINAIQTSVSSTKLINLDLMVKSVETLAKYKEFGSVDSLISGLANTEKKVMETREVIINAIGENGTEDEIITLLDLYEISKTNHSRMNNLLTMRLGSLGDERVIPILMEIAQDPEVNVYTRNRAVEILARKESPELVDFFIEMLGDPVSRDKVNEYALNVLGESNNERMIFALLEAYQTGKHEYFALLNTLINSLGGYKNPAIKDVFVEIAMTDGFPRAIRIKAIKSLARFEDPLVAKDLVKVLYDPSNYLYYEEIVSLIKSLGIYDQYKSDIRKASLEAMKKHISKDEGIQ